MNKNFFPKNVLKKKKLPSNAFLNLISKICCLILKILYIGDDNFSLNI